MKQRKSWMALLAATAMLAVTACGGNGNHEAGGSAPASRAPASAQASEAATPEPPAPVEIMIWDKPAADDPLKTVREETFSDFQAKYPYITVKHETAPTETNDRQAFMTAMAGNNGPDAYSQAYVRLCGTRGKKAIVSALTF